jgi:DNA-binding response OmpR family regulator
MKKVLFVEDEGSIRNVVCDKINKEGDIICLEAKNGEEGLRVSLKEKPDLILLDIIMPEMDGFVMLEKLRQDAWGKTAKVIILSNLSDKKYVLDSFRHEVYEYIVKTDIKIDDLMAKIKAKLA